ncbi:MAG: hypothetical protein LBI62_09755 [Candidatus Accumulibacter sp.]|nr:hypothetical protein [Accumulibacter sp.]
MNSHDNLAIISEEKPDNLEMLPIRRGYQGQLNRFRASEISEKEKSLAILRYSTASRPTMESSIPETSDRKKLPNKTIGIRNRGAMKSFAQTLENQASICFWTFRDTPEICVAIFFIYVMVFAETPFPSNNDNRP